MIYRVEIAIESAIESEWFDWMKRVHIPDVLRTGCFSECRIQRVLAPEPAEAIYVLQYQSRSLQEYERYRDEFAPALQKDHTERFAGRFRGSRQVLEEIGRIQSADAGSS